VSPATKIWLFGLWGTRVTVMITRTVLVCLSLVGLGLAGCAQQGNPATVQALTARGVGPATIVKVENGRHLDYDDISNMVSRGVPTEVIVGYLESTGSVYNFGPVQLRALEQQGASQQIINYLQESQGFYGKPSTSRSRTMTGSERRAYDNSPTYQDQQPFAYNEPIIDGFYDSGYEESLYSPFSFN
jgi:hypothetical protein